MTESARRIAEALDNMTKVGDALSVPLLCQQSQLLSSELMCCIPALHHIWALCLHRELCMLLQCRWLGCARVVGSQVDPHA